MPNLFLAPVVNYVPKQLQTTYHLIFLLIDLNSTPLRLLPKALQKSKNTTAFLPFIQALQSSQAWNHCSKAVNYAWSRPEQPLPSGGEEVRGRTAKPLRLLSPFSSPGTTASLSREPPRGSAVRGGADRSGAAIWWLSRRCHPRCSAPLLPPLLLLPPAGGTRETGAIRNKPTHRNLGLGDLRQPARLHQGQNVPDPSGGFLRWSDGTGEQRATDVIYLQLCL